MSDQRSDGVLSVGTPGSDTRNTPDNTTELKGDGQRLENPNPNRAAESGVVSWCISAAYSCGAASGRSARMQCLGAVLGCSAWVQ